VLDRLIYKAYQDRTALSEGFQAGETDYADEFKAEDIQPLSAVPGVHLAQAGAYELLDFNLAHPWLQDVHVRRAIALAIDRCKLVQVLILQSCEKYVGKSVVLPPSPDVDPTIKGFPFDLKQARAEMQAAGYDCSSGTCLRDGQPFPALHLATRQNDLQDRELAELLTQDLTTLGLPTSVDFYPPNILFAPYDYNGILATGQYDLMRFATTVPLDSDPNLYPLYHSSQIPSAANPGGGNWERVQDTELDRLFDTGRTTLDPAKRAAIYRQVQQIIVMRQVYTIALFEIPNMSLVSPNIGNFFDNPTQFLNQWNIGEWYLKSAGG
jgi:peptide/nickel transport system substrate-binding protein